MASERPIVPNTPSLAEERAAELRQLVDLHDLAAILHSWTVAVKPNLAEGEIYILKLDRKTRKTEIFSYDASRLDRANADFFVWENEQIDNPDLQVVQVWADSLRELRDAYPNYFANNIQFIDHLASACGSSLAIPRINTDSSSLTISVGQTPGRF
jgi:hypothetical protein